MYIKGDIIGSSNSMYLSKKKTRKSAISDVQKMQASFSPRFSNFEGRYFFKLAQSPGKKLDIRAGQKGQGTRREEAEGKLSGSRGTTTCTQRDREIFTGRQGKSKIGFRLLKFR